MKVASALYYVADWLERDASPLYLTSLFLIAPLSGQYVSQYEIPWDPLYSKANRKQDKPKQGILVMTFTCIHMQPLKEWCIGLTVAVRGMSGKDIHQCLHSKAKGRQ